MKILFCSSTRLVKELGASKPLLELAEEMRVLGWVCDTISIFDLPDTLEDHAYPQYPQRLRSYLHEHAQEYDVIDYDHEYLPFPRSEFSSRPLFVARSVLLAHHLQTLPLPRPGGIKGTLSTLVKGAARKRERDERVCRAQITIEQADLINVSNEDDRAELIRRGISADKIAVLPFGISRSRRALFDAVSSAVPAKPIVAFVGTFDYRKGANDFPKLVAAISRIVPDVRFRLLGTAGLFKTREAVLAHFPPGLRSRLDVLPRFQPEELPTLLSTCSVGIFPSYMEGFGFGILEMLAASIPVVAYRCPGPPMMLTSDYLAHRGDWVSMSAKIITMLQDTTQLQAARVWAKQRSQQFSWQQIAQDTSAIYSSYGRS